MCRGRGEDRAVDALHGITSESVIAFRNEDKVTNSVCRTALLVVQFLVSSETEIGEYAVFPHGRLALGEEVDIFLRGETRSYWG
jgi:hypothetical protein